MDVGVTWTVDEGKLVPPALLPVTEQEYVTSPTNPKTVIGEDVPVAVTVA